MRQIIHINSLALLRLYVKVTDECGCAHPHYIIKTLGMESGEKYWSV